MKLKSTFNYYNLLGISLYFSLIIGFYFDENLNLGAQPDWKYTDLPVIKDLVDDIKKITQIEIYTMSLDFLNKMIKQNETINNYNYKDFYISSIEDNKFFKPSK